MSDNIIAFGQRPTESAQTAANTSRRQEELQEEFTMARENAIKFLTDTADNLDHFVLCGVTKPPSGEGTGEFYILTSRIGVADFALTIAMLNKALNRNL
jgi:hypothetical protein